MENSTYSTLLKSSALVITAFGFVCFLTLINPFSFENNDNTPKRNIASTENQAPGKTSEGEKFKTETIVLSCNRGPAKSYVVNENTSQVQIKGRHCNLGEHEFNLTKISNISNKFEATVFELKKKTFTSDFIHIDNGTNIIEIEESSESGIKKVSKLIVKKNSATN